MLNFLLLLSNLCQKSLGLPGFNMLFSDYLPLDGTVSLADPSEATTAVAMVDLVLSAISKVLVPDPAATQVPVAGGAAVTLPACCDSSPVTCRAAQDLASEVTVEFLP